jgi:hypothetical protein
MILLRRLMCLLVPVAAAAATGCGRGDRTATSVRSAPPSDSTATAKIAPDYRWAGIYNYDRQRPTFRPCDFALAFPLRGSDSLLGVLEAKIDFQAPRPILRVFINAAGDTTRPDPHGPPRFTITGVGETHTPRQGECTPLAPPPAPPLDERALRAALTGAGVRGGDPRTAPAYLDGDDRTDAVVLLTGGATCSPAGCDLLALRGTDSGFALMSRTRHVRAPVLVREARNDGVRMLVAAVGRGGGFPGRDVRLLFRRGRGYPEDAMVEPPGVLDPNALLLIGPPLQP